MKRKILITIPFALCLLFAVYIIYTNKLYLVSALFVLIILSSTNLYLVAKNTQKHNNRAKMNIIPLLSASCLTAAILLLVIVKIIDFNNVWIEISAFVMLFISLLTSWYLVLKRKNNNIQ